MCGEHMLTAFNPLPIAGSSPHVRGTLSGGDGGPVPFGIIPACAGNTG